jgi:hypothetical protein
MQRGITSSHVPVNFFNHYSYMTCTLIPTSLTLMFSLQFLCQFFEAYMVELKAFAEEWYERCSGYT